MTTEKTTNSSLLKTFFANLIHDPNMKQHKVSNYSWK